MIPNPYSSVPTAVWVIGYVVVGGVVYYLLTKKAYAAPASGYTAPATAPATTPAAPPATAPAASTVYGHPASAFLP